MCIQALVQPLKFLAGTRRVWRCVLVSWLLAAIVAVPQAIVSVRAENRTLSPDMTQNITIYKCDSAGYTEEWQRKLYFTFAFRRTAAVAETSTNQKVVIW